MYTFEVFPGVDSVPLVADVVRVAHTRILSRLAEMAAKEVPRLTASARFDAGRSTEQAQSDGLDGAWWFAVEGHSAGVEMRYYDCRADIVLFRDEIRWSGSLPAALVDHCLGQGRMWCFKSSAGHAPITELAFGYLAAAVAELTQGFIHSDDGAWHRASMPMLAESFYKSYLRAEMTSGEWAARSCRWAVEIERTLR